MIDEMPTGERRFTMDELWVDHHGPLRRFCAGIIGPSDADDLAVETFLRCRAQLVSGCVVNPRSYLFRSAVNAAHNMRRAQDRERRRNARAAAVPLDGDRPELGHVRAAIGELSARQRAVLYLAYWEDQTESAIAKTLGLHVGTVHRHLHRAHKELRKALQ